MTKRSGGGDLSGGSTNYYKVEIKNPTTAEQPYMAECNDIIEALNMSFAEGNIIKAIWRMAAGRMNNGKPGTSYLYDAEKIEFYIQRILKNERTEDVLELEDLWVHNNLEAKIVTPPEGVEPTIDGAVEFLSRMAKTEGSIFPAGSAPLLATKPNRRPKPDPRELQDILDAAKEADEISYNTNDKEPT